MDYKIPTKPAPLGVGAGGRDRPSEAAGSSKTPASATESGPGAAAAPVLVQEYSLRVPKTNTRPISIMRFNQALGIDPSNWTHVRMAREDNSKLHKTTNLLSNQEEEMPKFGAGSEYGREAREEARRRKYGLHKRKYNPDDQPWLLKLGDKTNNRKYKGVREGGVAENASYFIFTQAPDGAFEVFPVQHWYNFTPIQRYKSLTSEEAEQEFGRRNKIMNYFSVMVRRRMKAEEDGDDEPNAGGSFGGGGKKGKKGKVSSDLKVSEMEDWADSDDEEMSEEDEDADEKKNDKKKKGAGKGKKGGKKKKKESDDEGLEDSDDGDEEGRELDYISDTSESGASEDGKQVEGDIKGVDQEQALRDLLESGSDSEEEGKEKKEASDQGEDEPGPNSGKTEEDSESKDKKKKKKKKKPKSEKESMEVDLSDDDGEKSDGKDEDKTDAVQETSSKGEGGQGSETGKEGGGEGGESGGGNSSAKRKATSDLINMAGSSSKKAKMELSPVLLQSAAGEGITEETVRRYLLRKPMTVTELLHKFKSKKTKISSQDMVNVIAHILKKINPIKRVQNQKMYLSLTATKS